MNIESKWLEDFLTLSHTKSFSQAAKLRHITQPAFSRRIKALEDALGAALIDRENLPITLTPSGKIFHITARNLVNQMNTSVSMLEELSVQQNYSVKVAAAHSLASFLTLQLANFQTQDERDIVLNLEAIDVDKATEALEQGECDLLIAFDNERLKLPPFSHQKIGNAKLLPVSACDEQGKAFWLPIVIICGPLGGCIGYTVTGILTSCGYDWTISFLLLAVAAAGCFLLFLLIPSQYINLNEV